MTKQAEQSNTARIFMSNMWNELDQVAWVWNESLLEKEIIKNSYLMYFSTVFQFFGFGFFFFLLFSLASILFALDRACDRFLYFSFPQKGGAGLVTRLLSLYPPHQRSPTTSAMRSPTQVRAGVLSVKL